jgi:hypothetical protein
VAVPSGASLEQITSSAGPGTTFCLAPGTFNVPNGVTLDDGDVLQGAGRTATFIKGTGAEHVLRAKGAGVDITVRSLDISGAVGDASCNPACGRAVFGNGDSWTLVDLRCHDNDNQCVGGASAAITMRDSECDHNGGGAAFNTDGTTRSAACIKRASTGAGRLLVTGSHIHHNFWAGVWCDFCTDGPFVVENSVITDNVSKGVSYEVSGGSSATDGAIIRNNTIQRNGLGDARTVSAGITCNSCAELTITGNIFGGNANGRAVGLVDARRGSWGAIYGIVVIGNILNGDGIIGCGLAGVTCSGNALGVFTIDLTP